jgi:predicted transcriptional regulator of viral defense system
MKREASGIETANRSLLARLNREATGPFTLAQATRILGLDIRRVRRLLPYLATRGWLARVQRGLYTTVPLGAADPGDWREDPWVVAEKVFAPCYIGGLSACEHWGLTEQLFRTVVVFSARPIRKRHMERQGTAFWIKTLPKEKLFGTRRIWRGPVRVEVSDPSRTLVDILDEPRFGGGIRHVAQVVQQYFTGDLRSDGTLLDYAQRLGSGAVYKRLGFLLEGMGIPAPDVLAACRLNQSSGLSLLDPSVHVTGRILKRWNLRVNVVLDQGSAKT